MNTRETKKHNNVAGRSMKGWKRLLATGMAVLVAGNIGIWPAPTAEASLEVDWVWSYTEGAIGNSTDLDYNDVLYDSERDVYLAVGDNGAIAYSQDLNNWIIDHVESFEENGIDFNSVVKFGNGYIAVGEKMSIAVLDYDTKDASVVIPENIDNPFINNDEEFDLEEVTVIDDVLWAGGEGGIILQSNDGELWQARLPLKYDLDSSSEYDTTVKTIIKGKDEEILIGASEGLVAKQNMQDWEYEYVGNNSIYKLAWNDQRYLLVGGQGTIFNKRPGSSWIDRNVYHSDTDTYEVTSENIRTAVWAGDRYVALGSDLTILESISGSDWLNKSFSDKDINIESAAWNGTQVVGVGEEGLLVVGGPEVDEVPIEQQPNTWQEMDDMAWPSALKTLEKAVQLDGKFYIAGLTNEVPARSVLYVYDQNDSEWDEVIELAKYAYNDDEFTIANGYGMAVLNNEIYTMGGYISSSNYALFHKIAPLNSQVWTALPDWSSTTDGSNTGRAYVAASAAGDSLYMIGGASGMTVSKDILKYTPDENNGVWVKTAQIAANKAAIASAVVNDNIYLFGGSFGPTIYNDVEVYDPALNTVTKLESPAAGYAGRVGASAAALPDGTIMLIGGSASVDTSNVPQSSVTAFHTSSGKWSCLANMPEARLHSTALTLIEGNETYVYVFGGLTAEFNAATSVLRYKVPAQFPSCGGETEVPGDNGGGDGDTGNGGSDGGSDGGNSGSGGDTGNGSTPVTTVTADKQLDVYIDGIKQPSLATIKESAFGTSKQAVIKVIEDNLKKKLDQEPGKKVTIPVTGSYSSVIGEINGGILQLLESRGALLELTTDKASYSIPAALLQLKALAEKLGAGNDISKLTLRLEIADSSSAQSTAIEQAAKNNGATNLVSPVEFTITASVGDKQVEVNSFGQYVKREIALPVGTDPTRITTGVVLTKSGLLLHVPTEVVQRGEQYFAIINSLTNSTYSVIYHPRGFEDVKGHWSEAEVNDMASRLVVNGLNEKSFAPDQSVTRAEFAAIAIRALGLQVEEQGALPSDVGAEQWYAASIRTAIQYHLITGYADGSFQPNQPIARSEAAAILSRALELADPAAQLSEQEITTSLAAFNDSVEIADWAKASLATAIDRGIMKGSNGSLHATEQVSRAQAAAMFARLLQSSKLI
ncbi:S-layer homology domain-containing protein [Paenibacillus sinopodophylli]|uniref:S-layer homology domain-containing protein n=1 Tax=Paenibacillus sinopodophylli TaxID=1837342 RepID=UPI001486C285|nr:S-layer homology domain-containing protein [Paenibacillus sinopodophylli]